MLNNVLEYLHASPLIREAFDAPAEGLTALYETAEGMRPFFAAMLARKTGRPVLYIAPGDTAAMRAAEDCAQWLGGGAAVLPPPEISFTRGTASQETAFRRLAVLQKARQGQLQVLCLSAEGLLTRLPPPDAYEQDAVLLGMDSRMEPQALIESLVRMGYERVDMVEGKGQCALRGAIVDAFPPAEATAVRIEFFDDEIDSIRAFDPLSQRSMERLTSAALYPAVEWRLPPSCAAKMREMISAQAGRLNAAPLRKDLPPLPEEDNEQEAEAEAAPVLPAYASGVARLFRDAEQLENGLQPAGLSLWAGALNVPCAWPWEYLESPLLVIEEPDRVKTRCQDRLSGFAEDFKLALERQEAVPEQGALLRSWEETLEALSGQKGYLLQDMLRGMGGMKPSRILRFAGVGAPKYVSRLKDLASDVAAWKRQGYLVLLLAGGEARSQRIRSALSEWGEAVAEGNVEAPVRGGEAAVWPCSLSRGFVMADEKLAVIADSDLFGASYRKARRQRTAGERIEAFTDLKEGDYVVHEAYGVGIFRGAVRLQSEGTYRDYLLIQYQGSDKLYVPTDQFDRVQKFIGGQDTPPPGTR